MSGWAPVPGSAEARGCYEITFQVEISADHGTVTTQQADCRLDIAIIGLKEDFEHLFNLTPEEQEWTMDGNVLQNDLTLGHYGVGNNNSKQYIIFVRKVSPRQ
ncbi:unnamed protein product [Lymnaea stagnalis]|uniref:Ubiquitin-like domain-containing protein n=1 Tax=Lymnaea stagnalis TaxID=6523 RepID=A0AAV2HRB7_LYMST